MALSDQSWGPAPRVLRAEAGRTLADQAYQQIRNDIVQGVLAPSSKLQPDVLRGRYDIGLSPLREALSRLTLDGLAVSEGQRGIFVAPASVGELLDIGSLRVEFAGMALERSMRLGGDEWESGIVTTYYHLNKLEKQVGRDPKTFGEEWERRNRDFHTALEAGCGSPWLIHFCDILYDQLERYRRLFVAYTEINHATYDEHRVIMELALARKPKAVHHLTVHLNHTTEIIKQRMTEGAV